jgi:signal transduction histidine kinase
LVDHGGDGADPLAGSAAPRKTGVMRRNLLSRSLSAKILLLTIACVLLGEILIYVPSIARFRLTYLQERIAAAHLAMLNLTPGLAQQLDMDMVDAILGHAGVLAVTIHNGPGGALMLGEITEVDRVHDLRDDSWLTLVPDAVESLAHRGERLLRVIGPSPQETGTLVDIIVPEAPMWTAMVDYSVRILTLSIVLSVLVAAMLFFGLQRMIVRPLRRVTEELAAFRDRPEDGTADRPRDDRADEIGVVEQELATMRHGLRRALAEKTRLAALGAAMSRIGHDLKNILATAVLISDRLESSADPSVRRVAPRLVETLDRAVRLCSETLSYARSGPPAPQPRRVALAELVQKVRDASAGAATPVAWRVDLPPGLELEVDPDQLFRVLFNLAQNAIEAMGEHGGELRIAAEIDAEALTLDVADTGPGIPDQVRARLFEPFAGSSKAAGNGLGLAICRELMRAHGGEIELLGTSEHGTVFRLRLPGRLCARAPAARRSAMPLETVARTVLLAVLLALAGCGYKGPAVAGYPGLQNQIQWFYDSNAVEQNATCTQPRMRSVTGAQVIGETPEQVVMNIRYYWLDEGQIDRDDDIFLFGGGGFQRCNGFAERTFTFTKMTDGSLSVRSMTGPQRRRSS